MVLSFLFMFILIYLLFFFSIRIQHFDMYGSSKGIPGIIAVIALSCIIVLYINLRQLNKTVVEPLSALAEEINRIDTNTVSASLNGGNRGDELNNMAEAVNNML
ncbi:MAG: hypothetical protein LBR47_01130, partial [Spirochaetaceae bacterium]|nr:hypothetical protein [Spirochaetaceae bacterium]